MLAKYTEIDETPDRSPFIVIRNDENGCTYWIPIEKLQDIDIDE